MAYSKLRIKVARVMTDQEESAKWNIKAKASVGFVPGTVDDWTP
jgi:hypothetical protein